MMSRSEAGSTLPVAGSALNSAMTVWRSPSLVRVVVHEEPAVLTEMGVKSQPQQAAFAAGGHLLMDVEERVGFQLAVDRAANPALLLDDVELPGAVIL